MLLALLASLGCLTLGARHAQGSAAPGTPAFDVDLWQSLDTRAFSPRPVDFAAGTVIGNHLYVFSGENNTAIVESNDVWAMDLTQRTWSVHRPLPGPAPVARYSHAGLQMAVGLHTYFVVFAGATGGLSVANQVRINDKLKHDSHVAVGTVRLFLNFLMIRRFRRFSTTLGCTTTTTTRGTFLAPTKTTSLV